MSIKYPYTDFHEMNMDWIIGQVREFQRIVTTFPAEIARIDTALADVDQQITAINLDINGMQADILQLQTDIAGVDSLIGSGVII